MQTEELLAVSEAATEPPKAHWSDMRKFCIVFAAVSLVLIVGPLLSIRSPGYLLLTSNLWNAKLDYPFSLKNRSFDVVIYGDSTASVGLDPRIISADLKVSVVNLAVTSGVLREARDYPLDRYLSANHKPKLLVLAISPSSVSIDQQSPEVQSIDAWWLISRYASPVFAAGQFLLHPRMLPALWSETIHQEIFDGGLLHRKAFEAGEKSIIASHGWLSYPKAVSPLQSCRNQVAMSDKALNEHSYINQFEKKYQALGIPVKVFFTPVPDCDSNLGSMQARLSGLALNEPYEIPRGLLADDAVVDHALPAGAIEISRCFAVAVKPALAGAR
jgi:hypothetical protein